MAGCVAVFERTDVAMTGDAVLGVAAGKRKLDIALLVNGKLKTKALEAPSAQGDDLIAWVRKQKIAPETVHFCVAEGEPNARFVALDLFDAGLHVSLVAPDEIHAFIDAERLSARADRLSAEVVARYCAARQPQPFAAPSKQSRTIDDIRARLQDLEGYRTTEMRRAEEYRGRGADTQAEQTLAHVAWLDESIARFRAALAELIDLRTDETAR
jgi:transposase